MTELTQYLAGEIHLVNAAHAADEHHLIRSLGEAERPCRGRQLHHLFQIAVGVKTLHAVVRAISDIDDVVVINHQTVRSIEIARLRAALSPRLDEVAVLIKLDYARIAITIGNERTAILAPADIRLLIELVFAPSRVLDDVGEKRPGFFKHSQRPRRAAF